MRDILPQIPDSILPLLSKNARLDMIDFIENNMNAGVKDKFEGHCELKKLTSNYLMLETSKHSCLEMRLINDTTLCIVTTCMGPAADSKAKIYSTEWQLIKEVERPTIDEFITSEIDEDVRLQLYALPLISASLSPDDISITWQLQTSEVAPKDKINPGQQFTITRLINP